MSVKREASGRRSVQVEVELPGTPEQIWQAIATGQGITSWFAPTKVEERNGGKIVTQMAPGMESAATITAWEPPLRLAVEDPGWAPSMPPVATEWTIETRPGGTCLVRVVHSLFASTDDWDNQLAGTETGWPGFFRILRLYLAHFPGQLCSSISVMGTPSGPVAEGWQELTGALGLTGALVGQKRSAPAAAPPFSGTVECVTEEKGMHSLLLRLEEPAPGFVSIGAFDCGGMVMASVSFYLYGERGAAAAAREQSRWDEWMKQQFPAAGEAGNAATGA